MPDPVVRALLESRPLVSHHYLATESSSGNKTHRGVSQRNTALTYIRENAIAGIVYFADDDNTYNPALFRKLSKLPGGAYTIFPVGNMGYFGFEGPIIGRATDGGAGRLTHWCCDFCTRRWNVDMAGLAFHTSILQTIPHLLLSYTAPAGFVESELLTTIEGKTDATLYLLPELLGQIHVWHDRSEIFKKAEYYISDWKTFWVEAYLPTLPNEIVKGFSKANQTLPRPIIL